MFDHLDRLRFDTGAFIFRKGDAGTCAYLIEEGEVEISDPGSGFVLARVGPGELFGEIALIDQNPRTATARTAMPTVLIEVRRTLVEKLLTQTDPIIRHLLNVVLDRFRHNMAPPPRPPRPNTESSADRNDVQSLATKRLTMLQDMHHALGTQQFELHYQPIFRLSDHRQAGFE
ncbi:MAG: cyclic nucleotide-binding domain-containing protein, partial [Rhodoferax sp.]